MKTEKIWPVGIVSVMVMFIAWMAAVVTVSLHHRPQLISENYYAEGVNLRALKEQRAAGDATGWRVSVRPMPASHRVELTVTETDGAPCDSLSGTVTFYRPSDGQLDIADRAVISAGDGRYWADVPRLLERGAWQAVAHLSRGAQSLDARISFFVDE